jgi:hypothetical protein
MNILSPWDWPVEWEPLKGRLIKWRKHETFGSKAKTKLFKLYGSTEPDPLPEKIIEIDGRIPMPAPVTSIQTGVTTILIHSASSIWVDLDNLFQYLANQDYWPDLRKVEADKLTNADISPFKMIFSNQWKLADKILYAEHILKGGNFIYATNDERFDDRLTKIYKSTPGMVTSVKYMNEKRRDESYVAFRDRVCSKTTTRNNPFYLDGMGGLTLTKTDTPLQLMVLNIKYWDETMRPWKGGFPCLLYISETIPTLDMVARLQYFTPKLVCLITDPARALDIHGISYKERAFFFIRERSNPGESGEMKIDNISAKLERWQWNVYRPKVVRSSGSGEFVQQQKKVRYR